MSAIDGATRASAAWRIKARARRSLLAGGASASSATTERLCDMWLVVLGGVTGELSESLGRRAGSLVVRCWLIRRAKSQ